MNTSSLKVFFDTSTLSDSVIWETYLQEIILPGITSTHNWKEYTRQWDVDSPRTERTALYTGALAALAVCDVAIFDVTIPSMRMGHEITIALDRNIPVLVLVNKQKRRPDSLFLQAVPASHLSIKSYSDTFDLLIQIRLFLREYSSGVKKRLDISLDEDLHAFVSREAERKGITKTEMMHRILKGSFDS
jgi:hypothetical protein